MKGLFPIILVLILLIGSGCSPNKSIQAPITPTLPSTGSPESTFIPDATSVLSADTTPPSPITGLLANNGYDGKVNLWWDKSTVEDFAHYNIYLNKAEITDVTGMKAIQQIKDIGTCRYQTTGLENGTKYYFAVTSVDKTGNEDKKVAGVNAMPVPMLRGIKDPDLSVDIYLADKVWSGTTLLADNHNLEKPRIIEVNMLGEVVWEYLIPQNLDWGEAGDVELLSNNNILFTSNTGAYEINRSGKIVWSYLTNKIDHDADRLLNGDTIFVFGMHDQKSDAQVTEVNAKGEIVWTWYAKDYFDESPYKDIYKQGSWTHTNAVTRLPNGNTLISLRNFDFVVEVEPKGSVVKKIGLGIFSYQHDPAIQPNGNVLATSPLHHWVVEIDSETGKIVWQFEAPSLFPRDADRLPNGNTLITGAAKILEITNEGNIVWQLTVRGINEGDKAQPEYCYKADRISTQQ